MVEINLTNVIFFITIIVWAIFLFSQIYLRLSLKRLERTDAELQILCKDTLAELEAWDNNVKSD